jgi:hypothetical protein
MKLFDKAPMQPLAARANIITPAKQRRSQPAEILNQRADMLPCIVRAEPETSRNRQDRLDR